MPKKCDFGDLGVWGSLGRLLGDSGRLWGGFGETLEGFGKALGRLSEAVGRLWEANKPARRPPDRLYIQTPDQPLHAAPY